MPRFFQIFVFSLASSIAVMANADTPNASKDFYWQTYQVDYADNLYSNCGKVCPEIEYSLIDTGNAWLDTQINKTVVGALALDYRNSNEPANPQQLEQENQENKAYEKYQATAVPSKAQYAEQINANVKYLIASNKEIVEERGGDWTSDSPPPIQVTAKPTYLGHKSVGDNRLELIEIETYNYTGGAHGVPSTSYYVFDMANKRQLTLDDILLPNQKANLEKAVKAKFIDWIKQNGSDPIEYQNQWAFDLTDNFTFTKEGVTFLYQPYEISPYALGMPEFTLNYGELKGIVKAEYLQ